MAKSYIIFGHFSRRIKQSASFFFSRGSLLAFFLGLVEEDILLPLNLDMRTVRFNHLLADLGIQYKVREQWVLYVQYQDQGYTASKYFEVAQADGSLLVKYQTEWTQKGRRFLYLFLKEKGILPVLEQQFYDAEKAR